MKNKLPLGIYALFCVFLAYTNAVAITADQQVNHVMNGFVHIAFGLYCTLAVHWAMGLAALLTARLVFDVTLNLFRGLAIWYISPTPTSTVDKAEIWLFGDNGWLPKLVYFALIVLYLVFANKLKPPLPRK